MRWLATDGFSAFADQVPDWYPLIQQAKWLGVPPWKLAEAPLVWQQWVGIAMSAEAEALAMKRKHEQ